MSLEFFLWQIDRMESDAHLEVPENASSSDSGSTHEGGNSTNAYAAAERRWNGHEDHGIVLVVQGHQIPAHRGSLATVSKFFRALFQHRFRDSREPVLCLDASGEMGLTVTAVKVLTMFSETKQLEICGNTAVQIFIAADALDVAAVRDDAETYLGQFMLQKDNFIPLWKLSRQFYMKILESFMDCLVLENFGWCTDYLSPRSYIKQWDITKLSLALHANRFRNCSEEQVFQAVVNYCRGLKEDQNKGLDLLAPGLTKSCANYLRYLQSVPRSLAFPPPGRSRATRFS